MKKITLFATALLIFSGIFAQETVSIMYYNILNYPQINSGRIAYLKTIFQEIQPDILVVNELDGESGVNSILNDALNENGITHYAAATWVDGPDDENMLFYNNDKLGLISQSEIATSLRDINEYILYYKDPTLTAASDTAYLYVYGAHLKAGDTDPDALDRASESATLKSYLLSRAVSENTIVGGDFNIYTSSEQAYVNLTFSSQANLYDVIGPGNYHNNNMFATHFTQSTRDTDQIDGGSTGGMDDRFDFILFSQDMISGSSGVKYKSGTYRAVGQDGLRWNSSLLDPINNSEATEVINALYYMSDHLPVYMEVEVGGNVGINETTSEADQRIRVYPNPADGYFSFQWECDGDYEFTLRDIQGRLIESGHNFGSEIQTITTSGIESGYYLLNLISAQGEFSKKILIK